ncbi:MAG TPA: hypothetical protein VLY23_18645 [Candidatus Acidoferrum sp.]|nr:hypothetical protein [Candidatus Acidoferrum sp.]
MKKIAACLLLVVFAVLAGPVSTHVVKNLSPTYLADGTGPTPPPYPMG